MNDSSSSNRNIASNICGMISLDFCNVDNSSVANTCFSTNFDGINIPSNGGSVPNTVRLWRPVIVKDNVKYKDFC